MIAYRNSQLFFDNISVHDIAVQFGTPTYAYSAQKILDNYKSYVNAFKKFSPTICYAVKACSNINILRLLSAAGSGFDCVSEGEHRRVRIADQNNDQIVVSGVGKTNSEIDYYLKNNTKHINAESVEEIHRINQIALSNNIKAKIGIRINPDVKSNTHDKITTGTKENKFGIHFDDLEQSMESILLLKNIVVESISFHIGSQITELDDYKHSYKKMSNIIYQLLNKGLPLKNINIGGGVGISYQDQKTICLENMAKLYQETLSQYNLKLIIEPGRSLVGNAGILISRIIGIKNSKVAKPFIFIDAGMNDLLRPAIYGSYHKIVPEKIKHCAKTLFRVAGPICESSDIFENNYLSETPEEGDIVAILDAGAYCFSMSSNYNSRTLPCEVMILNGEMRLIRQRQTLEDLFKYEFT